jgi:hypothetical protein
MSNSSHDLPKSPTPLSARGILFSPINPQSENQHRDVEQPSKVTQEGNHRGRTLLFSASPHNDLSYFKAVPSDSQRSFTDIV